MVAEQAVSCQNAGIIDAHHDKPPGLWSLGVLATIMACCLLLRGPVLWRSPGGMDEDWFAIPGWTVMREGEPRVPYAPERNRESVFYRVDVSLFALPPAWYYWQVPFHWVLAPSYGTSRLASVFAGFIVLAIVYRLGCRCYGDACVGLLAAGLLSLSRVFYFPAITARPDMLCTMFALAAMLTLHVWQQESSRWKWLIVAGLLLGLAGLTHPFALVACLQASLVVAIWTQGWKQRLAALAVLTLMALLPLVLWLPQIAAHPDIFRVQFFGNVLDRSGGGLLSRLLWPWESLSYHAVLLWEHAGPLQCLLMAAGLAGATLFDARRREPGPRFLLWLAWSGLLLLPACAGMHPTKGYWSYPGALLFLCLSRTLVESARSISARVGHPQLVLAAACLVPALALVPGSGLRATLAHLRHWNDPDYHRGLFVDQLLAELPADAKYTVDPAYVYDWYLSGRSTILGVEVPMYFTASEHGWDYLIAGRYALDNDLPHRLGGEFVRSFGVRDDLFACYAEVYRNPAK